MDWNALKNKALDYSVKALDASSKALEKGKEYAEKAKEVSAKVQEKKEEITEKIEQVKEDVSNKKEEVKEKFEEVKENIADKKEEITGESKSFFDKAKEMGSKAMDTTTGVLSKAAPALKIVADYEKIKDDKILAILFLKKDNEESKNLQLTIPLIMKNVWINGVTFRTVDIEDSQEIATKFNIESVPALIVFEKGEEKKKTTNIEEMKKYFKDFLI
ncbi:MAG: thioredoxin family protein [Candidatus Gracilibacteria bacterium]|nr:thioredoxin family protein [Candidatus Gracilibacteria bacterium]MDD2909128.1 thioredoxin family protein [Candidatus Gracilibacteria bacterium]